MAGVLLICALALFQCDEVKNEQVERWRPNAAQIAHRVYERHVRSAYIGIADAIEKGALGNRTGELEYAIVGRYEQEN